MQFASLMPFEPRLVRKCTEPLLSIMNDTKAVSVIYECLAACILGATISPDSQTPTVLSLCNEKSRTLLDSEDPNLKYLGLSLMSRLALVLPSVLVESQDTLFDCLDDEDPGIRSKAIHLIGAMVTKI